MTREQMWEEVQAVTENTQNTLHGRPMCRVPGSPQMSSARPDDGQRGAETPASAGGGGARARVRACVGAICGVQTARMSNRIRC